MPSRSFVSTPNPMANSSLRKASRDRRSTVSSKTRPTMDLVTRRSSAVESRKETAISSNSAGSKGSFAVKQTAAQSCLKNREISATQLIEPSRSVAKPSSGNSISSSKDYITVTVPLPKLQDRCNIQDERVKTSSVDAAPKMTPRSPLMQLIGVSQKIPADQVFRMLVSVTLLGSIWEVRMIMKAQETVKDVIKAALAAYSRQGRKLSGGSSDHAAEAYELYLSQFSLQYLDMDAKIMDVGARSFVLRHKKREGQNLVEGHAEVKRWWSFLSSS